jgi:hypothetical protein
MMSTPPEHLYRPDASIIEWRKLFEKATAAFSGRCAGSTTQSVDQHSDSPAPSDDPAPAGTN